MKSFSNELQKQNEKHILCLNGKITNKMAINYDDTTQETINRFLTTCKGEKYG